ncbi:hypothetical protein F5Y15DRAFT_412503 [Xylariaceae sp. FL0016]|nr:hypothetical protein F5Y15DRAFT_412503 [Xylariaceae sp. FL0016]
MVYKEALFSRATQLFSKPLSLFTNNANKPHQYLQITKSFRQPARTSTTAKSHPTLTMSSSPDTMGMTTQRIAHMQRRPSTFLSLAPETSASYPTTQEAQDIKTTLNGRRTSSVSSAGSVRILKLGPVHWGEHQGDHKDDFHEVAVQ